MKTLLPILLFAFFASYSWAQSSIQWGGVSAYENYSTGSYSVEWVVGEVINDSFTIGNYFISSGLTESSSSQIITSISKEITSTRITSYPSPFSKTITLESEEVQFTDSKFEFYDVLGTRVESHVINIDKNKVNFLIDDLSSGIYILIIKRADNSTLTNIKLIRE